MRERPMARLLLKQAGADHGFSQPAAPDEVHATGRLHGSHKMQVDQDRESDDSYNCERDDRTRSTRFTHHHHAAAGQGA
jgi:hypothetical protein